MVKYPKAKGKRFEDKVASRIADVLGLSKDQCHRASFSGVSSWEYGDIFVQKYNIVIECKFHESIDLRMFLKDNSTLSSWIEQLREASEKFKKVYEVEPLSVLAISKSYYPIVYILFKYYDYFFPDVTSYAILNNDLFVFLREEDFYIWLKQNKNKFRRKEDG